MSNHESEPVQSNPIDLTNPRLTEEEIQRYYEDLQSRDAYSAVWNLSSMRPALSNSSSPQPPTESSAK